VLSATLGAAGAAGAEGPASPPFRVTEERAACASHEPLRQPLFGDTHVHTAFSFDSVAQQGTRATPRDAYRFARGEPLGLPPFDREGRPLRSVKLHRPLDWTVVTDHSEMLGEVRLCMEPGSPAYQADACWVYRSLPPMGFASMGMRNLIVRKRWAFCGEDARLCLDASRRVWREIRDAAEDAYDRSPACSFTSFVGYEWTGTIGFGVNLHRNVIFRNERVPETPISWVETPSAAELWKRLDRQCAEGLPGCEVLTIPHNPNLSAGHIFASAAIETAADREKPVTAEEARARARFEPLVEIMQKKGDSECLLGAETTDEACGFEKLAYNSFAGESALAGVDHAPRRADMVREALKRGLAYEAQLGANPFKYGFVASTDTHVATAGLTTERDYPGDGVAGAGAVAAISGAPRGLPEKLEFNPGGLAVVWAEENSRDAIFAAMLRKETYGTSGTRLVVRFFGGWDPPEDLCQRRDFAARGYASGVPMGGDLPARPAGARAPRFAVSALMDPGSAALPGAPLQRIQIVKGFTQGGETREKVFEVAGGPNGASVDLASCERRGDGAESLCGVWSDPEFDPAERAFYYARVLENPSCRWSQYLCRAAGVECGSSEGVSPGFEACCSPSHVRTTQERAWTSPIWYAP